MRQDALWISATGIGSSPWQAKVRHDSERAERATLARSSLADQNQLTGSAAGAPDDPNVAERAACELVERWLCHVWWAGKRPALSPCATAMHTLETSLRTWPRRQSRQTGVLALQHPGLPVVHVVWSCMQDGRSLCFGMAAASNVKTSVRSAVREVFQMEFGLSVVRHKHQNHVALSGPEQSVMARADALGRPEIAPLLTPTPDFAVPDVDRPDTLGALETLGFSPKLRTQICANATHKVAEVAVARAALGLPTRSETLWSLYGTV
ncbi:MAG: YcaO-like family protein [Sedimentitalea sp.]